MVKRHRAGRLGADEAGAGSNTGRTRVRIPACPDCLGDRREVHRRNAALMAVSAVLGCVFLLSFVGCIMAQGQGPAPVVAVVSFTAMGGCAIVESLTRRRYWICDQCDTAEPARLRPSDL